MTTASESSKALRGTKRVCHACEARFYDLSREPIVCPSCGAEHIPAAPPPVAVSTRVAPVAGKTGWRGHKRPGPKPPETTQEQDLASPDEAATEDLDEETEAPATTVDEDDIVLEHEPDDGDVSGLVDHDVEGPKDR